MKKIRLEMVSKTKSRCIFCVLFFDQTVLRQPLSDFQPNLRPVPHCGRKASGTLSLLLFGTFPGFTDDPPYFGKVAAVAFDL